MNIKKLFIECTMHAIVQAQLHNKITGGMRLKSRRLKMKSATSHNQVHERKAKDAKNHSTNYPVMQLHPQITKEHKAFWSK